MTTLEEITLTPEQDALLAEDLQRYTDGGLVTVAQLIKEEIRERAGVEDMTIKLGDCSTCDSCGKDRSTTRAWAHGSFRHVCPDCFLKEFG